MDPARKEATPIELGALLMDAVCKPGEQEQQAVRQLAAHLGVDLERLQLELMYLRAFAVEFATIISLGESPAREAVATQYRRHWDQIAEQAGEGVVEELNDRLAAYAEAVNNTDPGAPSLRDLIGQAFARSCQDEDRGDDLSVLGGSMFAALFDEIADLYETVEIVLLEDPLRRPASPN